jgi:hypothetical protein
VLAKHNLPQRDITCAVAPHAPQALVVAGMPVHRGASVIGTEVRPVLHDKILLDRRQSTIGKDMSVDTGFGMRQPLI